jgi:DNA-binding NtrC family response regulator
MWGAEELDEGSGTSQRSLERSQGNAGTMTARRVLIVEDSLIIAMEAEEILHEIGMDAVEIASNLQQAAAAIDAETYDFALLDVNLGEGMSFDFARSLNERGIRFGFVSGYSDTQDFPDDLQQVPLLVKPFDAVAMQNFIDRLFPDRV